MPQRKKYTTDSIRGVGRETVSDFYLEDNRHNALGLDAERNL